MPNSARSPRFKALLFGSSALAGVAILPSAAMAVDFWSGGTSSDWYDTLNWNNGVPTSATIVNIGVFTSSRPTVISGGTAFASEILLANDANHGSSLTIQNGGKLSSTSGAIAVFGTAAMMTVTGGSTWNVASDLTVGDVTVGTLTISGASKVTDLTAVIGNAVNAAGTVNVTGAGSTWSTGLALTVGKSGYGALNISNGAVVTDQSSIVGELAGGLGSAGNVTVSGVGSTWNNATMMKIGASGNGTLTVDNGGKVTDVDAIIGESAVGVGSVTVTGSGSSWISTGTVDVGLNATGNLYAAGGTLNVLGGGTVSASYLDVATKAGSSGALLIDGVGSTVTSAHEIHLGYNGTATVKISGGGQLNGADGYIGGNTGSLGMVGVIGAGSKWTSSGNLNIGFDGKGILNILSGGTVADDAALLGVLGGTGSVDVDGAGSTWTNSGTVNVGFGGTGQVLVSNGGHVSSAGADLGVNFTSTGTVTVGGTGSRWDTLGGGLTIGDYGTGDLSILGAGTVTAASTYLGFKAGSTGTVLIDGAGSALNTSFVTHIGIEGTGEMTLSNGGTLASDYVIVAEAAGSSGKLVIGADVGDAPAAAGYLNGSSGPGHYLAFGVGDGTLVLNHTSNNYVFDAILSGKGTIEQQFGTTYLSTDSSGFTGLASVAHGKLVVNADFSGATASVSDGGALGGSGTVRDLIAGAFGTVTPGNSIGTLHVANLATFNAGSTYQVEVNAAGASDLVAVGGLANINGGTVAVLAAAGQYAPTTQYTILNATAGVNGTYSGVTVNSAFLAASLSYGTDNVYLNLDRINAFNTVGGTANQRATGAGLDSIAVGNAFAENLALQSDSAKRAALDQLSGEVHASIKGVMIDDSRFARDAALYRLRDAFDAVGAVRSPVLAYADGEPVEAAADADRFALWGRGFGAWGALDGDSNAASIKRDIGGLFVGADALVADTIRLGVLGGYSRSDFSVDDRKSSGASEDYHLGLYGGTQWGALAFRSGAVYTWQGLRTSRSVALPGLADQLDGKYSARTAQVFGEFGYRVDAGQLAFEPFANLAYVNLATDGFSEKGGMAALTGDGDTTETTFTTLGLRGSVQLGTDNGVTVTARGMLGWRHAFGDTTPLARLAFAGGLPFTVAGTPIAQDTADIEAGLDVAITPTATLGIAYGGQFGSAFVDQSVRGSFNVKF